MENDVSELCRMIERLEKETAVLEPNREQRQELFDQVNQYAEKFLDRLPEGPVFQKDTSEGKGILDDPITATGISVTDALDCFDKNVIRSGLNPASPGHLGYIPGSGLYFSALGDFLAAVTNRYSGIYAASPGAARMETMIIKWFAKAVGYPDTTAGDLTSGGSIANLSAIVAARDAKGLRSKDFSRAVVYLCEHTHHCVEKAVRTAGMADSVIRHVAVDDAFRLIPDHLEEMVEKDKSSGLMPWLLVASAGTTDTGSVDPLYELAKIASKYELWYHVDGAYGASFVLCDSGRQVLKGMEKSDSLTMDPHKGLFAPFGTGILLVKKPIDLHRPYQYQANYLQDEKKLASMDQISSAEMSPELSRHFRGMRVWLALKLAGVNAFSKALEEKMLLARYAWHRLSQIEQIETGPYPDLSIVIFRYIPQKGSADEFNQELIENIMHEGSVYMSSTLIQGKFMLRMAIMSFRTHLNKINQAIDIIEKMAVQISSTKG